MKLTVNVEAFKEYLDQYIDPYEIPGAMEALREASENDIKIIEKRTQSERLTIIEALLVGINSEIQEGNAEQVLLQAVNCQIEINRIVFKLNKIRGGIK